MVVHSNPENHPRTSDQEKQYIADSIGLDQKKNPVSNFKICYLSSTNDPPIQDEKHITPWLAILTSLPAWGINLGHFASNWGNYTLMSMLPTYMANILRFNLSAVGTGNILLSIHSFEFTRISLLHRFIVPIFSEWRPLSFAIYTPISVYNWWGLRNRRN